MGTSGAPRDNRHTHPEMRTPLGALPPSGSRRRPPLGRAHHSETSPHGGPPLDSSALPREWPEPVLEPSEAGGTYVTPVVGLAHGRVPRETGFLRREPTPAGPAAPPAPPCGTRHPRRGPSAGWGRMHVPRGTEPLCPLPHPRSAGQPHRCLQDGPGYATPTSTPHGSAQSSQGGPGTWPRADPCPRERPVEQQHPASSDQGRLGPPNPEPTGGIGPGPRFRPRSLVLARWQPEARRSPTRPHREAKSASRTTRTP